MLHWPDSMFPYLAGGAALFPNDAFGQYYASELMFIDLVDQDELHDECIKYYANILTPFSSFVSKKIAEVIVTQYAAWAADWQENRIALLYDSMWDGTRKLAEAIAQGIVLESPETTVVLHNVPGSSRL